ncbi:sodium ion-translocating decarboxylase subunit beta [Vibrio chagasii]|nr:sodium ion-translocating decarboxylase subunit beta [Vibrio chagasii]
MTDFGALIANPKTLWLCSCSVRYFRNTVWRDLAELHSSVEITMADASSIAIIGGADGLTAIFSECFPDLS